MGKEASYIRSVNKYLPPAVHAEGMHNVYRGGTPDVYYEGPDGCLWAEYKFFEKLPPTINLVRHTAKTKPMLSVLQQVWLERAHGNQQAIAVIVGSPEGGLILYGLSWQKPISREAFQQLARPKKDIAHWIECRVCGGVR